MSRTQRSALLILFPALLFVLQAFPALAGQNNPEHTATTELLREEPEAQVAGAVSRNDIAVISSRQMDYLTDITVEDVIRRLPGVQVNRSGRPNLHGIGEDRFLVTLDGRRMATTGLGDRSVALSLLSADLIRDVEVIRFNTPDMDADALAGTINLSTRRNAATGRELRIIAGGGGNTRYLQQMSPEARFAVRYADAPRDDLSFAITLSHDVDRRGYESLSLGYGAHDFGNGTVDVYERISPALHMDERSTTAGLLHLTYNPSDITRFQVRGLFSKGRQDRIRHTNSWNANGDWLSPQATGEQGAQGHYGYSAMLNDPEILQHNVTFEGSHLLDRLVIRYNAGWAHGQTRQYRDEMVFELAGLDFEIHSHDTDRPSMLPVNIPLQEDETIDSRRIRFQYMDRVYDDHIDNTFSAGLDLELPVGPLALQAGTHARSTNKEGDFSDTRYTYLRQLTLDQFHKTRHGNFDVLDEYFIPSFVDPYSARSFYTGSRPTFMVDERRHFYRSGIRNYTASEQVYAGYGMAGLQTGPFHIMAGVRVEHTEGTYDGRLVFFDDIGSYVSSADTSVSHGYTNLFPNAQLEYAPSPSTRVVAAYSRSINRPDFNMLAPYELVHVQNETLSRGNPELDPMTSDNLNLFAEQEIAGRTLVTAGLFYKRISGYIHQTSSVIAGGPNDGWTEFKLANSDDEATIYGVEIGVQEQFRYLPGVLANMGMSANYTWSESDYEIAWRSGDVALPGHSPHAVNAALHYEQGRFSGQVTWHYTSETVHSLSSQQALVIAQPSAGETFIDRHSDGWSDLSVAFRLRISQQFRFWADVSNLLRNEYLVYDYDRDLYPVEIEKWGGIGFRAGLRFDL
ncbi:TonB-dependent receptor [Balneolales bacterium ANBcel1]|nr:TonB-dependent receptor [Balneolales bacterium ANBcel1]